MINSFEINFDWLSHFSIVNNKIQQKENTDIEFKETFHSPKSRDKKLHKWIASFANSSGGLIIFGVKNDGEVIGLLDRRLHDFDNKDLTQELLDFFSPEIKYELFIKVINSKELGFLYIHEAQTKPVVTIKSADNTILESDIFYRYPGQSKKISYPELKNILEYNYRTLNEKWMNIIKNIAQIGVDNIGLLNIQDGEIIGTSKKLLIPEELLSKIKFINEGTFVEKDGAPTLKLIGDVQPVDSKNIIQIIEPKFQVVTQHELFDVFLKGELKKDVAFEFFRKVLYENSVYYPIYFYLITSGLSFNSIIELIDHEHGSKCVDLKKRFDNESTNFNRYKNGNMNTGTNAALKIIDARNKIIKEETFDVKKLESLELRYVLQAITQLSQDEINRAYILNLLETIYEIHFDSNSITKTIFRQTVCHVDLNIFGIDFFNKNNQ